MMSKRSIQEIIKQLKEGKTTARELYGHCRKRAEVLKELNFFITTNFHEAECKADEIDERITKGGNTRLLEGIPVAFKDNFSTKGIETTCASNALQGYKPPYTAAVVERMLNEGAINMGKLNMDEFAMGTISDSSATGPIRNPWCYPFEFLGKSKKTNCTDVKSTGMKNTKDWFVSGGSSGGSAVSVAVGACIAALGSDTGGSVRVPAAFCGVVGYKPTYGLLSRHGLIPLVHSLDCPGILARSVDDTTQVLNTIAGCDPLDSTTDPRPYHQISLPENISIKDLHIGIPQEYRCPDIEDDVLNAWSKCVELFEGAGARISQVSLPHHQYGISCYNILNNVEVASNMSIYDGVEFGHRSAIGNTKEELYAETRHEGFNDVVRGRILAGNYFLLKNMYEKYFEQAMRVRNLISTDFQNIFESGINTLLAPTVNYTAMTLAEYEAQAIRGKYTMIDSCTVTANLTGLPAISIPVTLSSRGLPIGLQLIAPRFSDHHLLTTAKWLEKHCQFPYQILDDELMTYEQTIISTI